MSLATGIASIARPFIRGLEALGPISLLILRVWVAWIFLKSALTKGVLNWEFPFFHVTEATVQLFEYEYEVPFVSHTFAAVAGSWTEFVAPILLIIGFMGRFSAGVLFFFNIVAVYSYWSGLTSKLQCPPEGAAGLITAISQCRGVYDHYVWGIALLVLFLYGPGKLSFDHLFRRRYIGTAYPA